MIALYRDLEFEILELVNQATIERRDLVNPVTRVDDEILLLERAQEIVHRMMLDDLTIVDDRDMTTQVLGLLEIMRRQYDRRARLR